MPSPLQTAYLQIRTEGNVLDVGCFGFGQVYQAKQLGLTSVHHSGVDYSDIGKDVPDGYVFRSVDLNKEPIPFQDDEFDLVVCNHIIEHISHPIDFFSECI